MLDFYRFIDLPTEILEVILEELQDFELHALRNTCHLFRNLLTPLKRLHLNGINCSDDGYRNSFLDEYDAETLDEGLKAIISNPVIAEQIVSANINLRMADRQRCSSIVRNLAQLPNLRKLRVSREIFKYGSALNGKSFHRVAVLYIDTEYGKVHWPLNHNSIVPIFDRDFVIRWGASVNNMFPYVMFLCFDKGMISVGDHVDETAILFGEEYTFRVKMFGKLYEEDDATLNYYKDETDYVNHMRWLFRRYRDGLSLSWEESGKFLPLSLEQSNRSAYGSDYYQSITKPIINPHNPKASAQTRNIHQSIQRIIYRGIWKRHRPPLIVRSPLVRWHSQAAAGMERSTARIHL